MSKDRNFRGSAPGTTSPSVEGDTHRDSNHPSLSLIELNELADQVGGFIEYWGFKEIHGRIWTHLYVSTSPLDSTTLVKRLKVSKALVSFAVHDLLEHRVIEEVSKGPRGTVLFRANPDLLDVILNVLRTRERKMLARIHSAHRLLAHLPPKTLQAGGIASDRVQQLGELIATAENALDLFITLRSVHPDFPNENASDDEKRSSLALQLQALTLSSPQRK